MYQGSQVLRLNSLCCSNVLIMCQEALRSGFENLVIPAFEQSCRNMFEQVDSSFQMGMAEHTANTQQQFESSHNALASNLQVCSILFPSASNFMMGKLSC